MPKQRKKPRPARPNATGRNPSPIRFIQIDHRVAKSYAFRSLRGNSIMVLLAVWQRNNGSNNGQISFAAREGGDIGLSKDQVTRSLNELMEKGFLVCTRAASFGTNDRKAREWRLTMEPTQSALATNDFLRFQETPKPSAKKILPDWRVDAVENES